MRVLFSRALKHICVHLNMCVYAQKRIMQQTKSRKKEAKCLYERFMCVCMYLYTAASYLHTHLVTYIRT